MLNLQLIFEDIGGFGLYQALVCAIGSITCCFAGLVISGSAFNNLLICSTQLNSSDANGSVILLAVDSALNSSSSSISKHGFVTSVSAMYNLCDSQASLGELSSVFLLAGCIPGSLLAGPAVDALGRIPGTLVGLLGSVATNVLATFAPYFWLHLASRTTCGFFVSWTLGSIFVYGNEVLMTVHRSRFVKLYNFGPSVGYLLLAYIGYATRDYKQIMTATNYVAILPIAVIAFLPESPSWLMSQKNKSLQQVRQSLCRIAWINRRSLPADIPLVAIATTETSGGGQVDEPEASVKSGHTGASLCAAIKSVLSDRAVLAQLLSTCLYGFSSGFAYYGFTFVISHAVPNIYITISLMGAVEPPSLLFLNVFSRSRTLFLCALATATSCFAIGIVFVAIPPDDVTPQVSALMIGLAVVGKFFSNISFCAIVAVGAEIYPTAVRNTGLGVLLATLRTGCMLSPIVNFIPNMPARFVVLGSACVMAAFPALILPDTRVRNLTDSDARQGITGGAIATSQLSSQAL